MIESACREAYHPRSQKYGYYCNIFPGRIDMRLDICRIECGQKIEKENGPPQMGVDVDWQTPGI